MPVTPYDLEFINKCDIIHMQKLFKIKCRLISIYEKEIKAIES